MVKQLFSFYENGIVKTKPSKDIDINDFTEILKHNNHVKLIKKIRGIKNKKDRDKEKRKLSYVTFAGIFTERGNNNLNKSSGFACLDVDDISDLEKVKQKVINNKFTHLLFKSPSGKGLKLVVRIPEVNSDEEYKQYWISIAEHYNLSDNDEATKDISRACFVSYDPEYFFNPDSEIYTDKVKDITSHAGNAGNAGNALKDDSKSGLEYRKIISLLKQDKERVEIYKHMDAYSKWKSSSESYKNITFEKAENYVLSEKRVGEIPKKIEEKKEKIKFHYNTDHLPYFDSFSQISLLEGKEYKPILKGVYFLVLGRLATTYIKRVSVGELRTDLRIHGTIPLSSGQGKKNIKITIKRILDKLNYEGHVPTSMHPEQFIGKVINRGTNKKPEWIQNEGYLSRDYVIIDECYNMLMSKDQNIQDTRKNFRIAKDPIGENLVEKKSVDNTFDEDEMIRYCPEVVSVQFLQPKSLPPEIVEEGDFRRDLILYVKGISSRDKTKDYSNRLLKSDDSSEHISTFTDFCKMISKDLANKKIQFTNEAVKRLIELHSTIVQQGFFHSEKGANFSKMVDFTLQDFLVKLSSLIGIANKTYTITPEIVELAFTDLFEFFHMQLDFVNEKVRGQLDYGEGWKGAVDKDQKCLEWLYNNDATDSNSQITLEEFKKEIASICKCSLDMAQKHYQRFKNMGWIVIEHVFQKYYVYLAFTPKYIGSKLELSHAGNVGNAYQEIAFNKKNNIRALPALPSLPTCSNDDSSLKEYSEELS